MVSSPLPAAQEVVTGTSTKVVMVLLNRKEGLDGHVVVKLGCKDRFFQRAAPVAEAHVADLVFSSCDVYDVGAGRDGGHRKKKEG